MFTSRCLCSCTAVVACTLSAGGAFAVPVAITYAGYWHETVGSNSLGHAGGGSTAGTPTTLFVAETDPGPGGGTTASASFAGVATNAPTPVGVVWTRRKSNPGADQLEALTVEFRNGADTASFTGRSLASVVPMPLVGGLAVDASHLPLQPRINWTLPDGSGIDIDRVQLVFYSNITKAEIGSRVTLGPLATFYLIRNVPQHGS